MLSKFEMIETEPITIKEEPPKAPKTRKRAAVTKKSPKEDEEGSSENEFEDNGMMIVMSN